MFDRDESVNRLMMITYVGDAVVEFDGLELTGISYN